MINCSYFKIQQAPGLSKWFYHQSFNHSNTDLSFSKMFHKVKLCSKNKHTKFSPVILEVSSWNAVSSAANTANVHQLNFFKLFLNLSH